MKKPPIMSTKKPLPFHALSPMEFERMCLWLVEREGYLRPQQLGESGSDRGRDVVGYKRTDAGEELWYFQCKRYKRIGAPTLKKEVDKYNDLAESDPELRPVGIVFVTSASLSATARDDIAAYCQEHGYAYEFWARTELDMLVKKHPDVVGEFFDASSELLEHFVRRVEERLDAMPSPSARSTEPVHIFLCYKRSATPDQRLAEYLFGLLAEQGHDVFMDSRLRAGTAWLDEIDREIKASDYLVVLLSKESADSERVRAEVKRAYEYRRRQCPLI